MRIFAAEGITPFACELQDRFPFFVGSEFAPTTEQKARIAPVEHQDLAALTYPDESFDICITNDVFEHLPNLSASIAELRRVLTPRGVLLSTFPFLQNRNESVIKSRLTAKGEIEYLMEAEYHGNPVDPKSGSLVFQIPAWEILDTFQEESWHSTEMVLLSSRKSGLVSRDYPGVFMLVSQR
ncbi:class I SAM-dependent methyltransferase [Aphanothece stagnina]|uniref:class I SAM-dependent methyltransferase n=1 Tax=Aphanothece stagnina TaxID=1004305 RepID=UPI00398E39AC